jgi:SAM-dependent methyltransferase
MLWHTDANIYQEFYEHYTTGALRSARIILPLVLANLPVRSAVDIGCGHGPWLRALQEFEITDVAGYDGDYVDRSRLLMDPAKFTPVDLRGDFEIRRTFDLAIALEVAEHLPSEFADPFIKRLVMAAPFVLFSAAIPGQRGVHHVNEQWQDYWRSIFHSFRFSPVDLIRPEIWGHPDVEFWYQQNTILYCSAAALRNNQDLKPVPDNVSLNRVHPTLYEARLDELKMQLELLRARPPLSLRAALKLLPALAWNAAARRVKRSDPKSV